jgi:hypothetical protein
MFFLFFYFTGEGLRYIISAIGEMAERLKALVLKTSIRL